MSKLVLGLGTSHSSQLSLDPEMWGEQGKLDAERTPFNELLASAPDWMEKELGVDVWREKHRRAQAAIRRLGEILDEAAPDILVVVGDDQEELFLADCMPAFAVFWGEESWDRPPSEEQRARLSPQRKAIQWAIHADAPEAYPGVPAFARHLLERLIDADFDPAQVSRQHEQRSLGHAYTFVRRRLMSPEMKIPLVPIFINTYVPPNQPSAARCYRLGQVLREAIESWPDDSRVAVVGSGGLSHFVVDTELDRQVLDALKAKDRDALAGIPRDKLQSGSSEILNWIAVGGAVEDMTMDLIDYIEGYRTAAGTGVGLAFAVWR